MNATVELMPHEKAKAWRIRNRYSIKQLSEITGYSRSAIDQFEAGIVRGDLARPVPAESMRRYTLCCAAIHAGLTDWDFD